MSKQENHKELCLLYENAAANLELLKKSQWQVYVFYSAVAAFLISHKEHLNNEIKIFISVLLFIGVIVAEFFMAHFRQDMIKYRKMLKGIYERFGYPFNEIRTDAKGEKKAELNSFEIIFKWAGCIYIFAVFALATLKLLPQENIIAIYEDYGPYSLFFLFISVCPLFMDDMVDIVKGGQHESGKKTC